MLFKLKGYRRLICKYNRVYKYKFNCTVRAKTLKGQHQLKCKNIKRFLREIYKEAFDGKRILTFIY